MEKLQALKGLPQLVFHHHERNIGSVYPGMPDGRIENIG
jgi:hypothetical protein